MTAAQIKCFWPVFSRHCDALGIDRAERDTYRTHKLMDLFGVDSLHVVGKTGEFETLMSTLLAEAGEYDAAANYTVGDVRRMTRLVNDVARQVFELKQLSGKTDGDIISYCLSILDRMGYRRSRNNSAEWWMDLDFRAPIKIFQALDTHRRRLVKALFPEAKLRYKFGEAWA